MNGYTPRGGEFATAPRGGLDREQVREIVAHRAKERPTPWSALAKRYGRCEADIRALFDPKPENDNRPVAAVVAFAWTDDTRSLLRAAYIDLNMSAEATAELLGCHPKSVIRTARAIGLRKRAA